MFRVPGRPAAPQNTCLLRYSGRPKKWVPDYKLSASAGGGEPSYSAPAAAYYTTMIYLFCSLVIILSIIIHAVYDPQTNIYNFRVCDPQTLLLLSPQYEVILII